MLPQLKQHLHDLHKPMQTMTALDSPLMALPAELRNHIWELALTHTIDAEGERTVHPRLDTRRTTIPPLLRACKQTRKECSMMFFANTKFIFYGLDGTEDRLFAPEWLSLIGEDAAKAIRRATFIGPLYNPDTRCYNGKLELSLDLDRGNETGAECGGLWRVSLTSRMVAAAAKARLTRLLRDAIANRKSSDTETAESLSCRLARKVDAETIEEGSNNAWSVRDWERVVTNLNSAVRSFRESR